MPWTDPYLRIAASNNFADYFPQGIAEDTQVDVILEFAAEQGSAELLRQEPRMRINIAHVAARSKFVTASIPWATLRGLMKSPNHPWLASICLAQTLMPQRAEWQEATHSGEVQPVSVQADPPRRGTLAALIDHGCPFAHEEFMAAGRTRVVTLWDQDCQGDFARIKAVAPAGFFRGREITGAQLQCLIDLARTPAGGVDETGCYAQAPYSAMDFEVTHGSHVLGRFVGCSYGPASPMPDKAALADIAFVQLPRTVLQAPSAGAMHRCILDGLRYLKEYARVHGYDACVAVCSYGSYLGPHDSSSLFERALDAFLDEPDVPFHVVFPAGNGREESLHAELKPAPGKPARISWNLPGDNEVAAFAELWLPAHSQVQVSIDNHGPWLSEDEEVQQDGQGQIVLRVAPTQVSDGTFATPVRQLRVELETRRALSGPVHAYIAWGGANIGFESRMRQTYWEPPQQAGGGVGITDRGTLMGSACGKSKAIVVVGGYVGGEDPADWVPAEYSGVGPTRGSHRHGPSFLALTDEIPGRGIPGPGTRSGTRVYIGGTSGAAPQGGRALLNANTRGGPLPIRPTQKHGLTEAGQGFLDLR